MVEEPSISFDRAEHNQWLPFLQQNGYCIIRAVASAAEVEAARDYLWEDMRRLFEVDRDDVSTWGKLPNGSAGILSKELPHTRGPWLIRALESIRAVFGRIWGTDKLLVSMDSVIVWLPWWVNPHWEPVSEGLHVDQNPYYKIDMCCVQGMVPLLDVTEETGGLEVVPFSHQQSARERFKTTHPQYSRNSSDWCLLRTADALTHAPILLKSKAGDIILWDSRLIHGGRVGRGERRRHDSVRMAGVDLARLSIPVCMTPREFATEQVQSKRKKAFTAGSTFTHWPHEAVCTNFSSKAFVAVDLTERSMDLV